jgi:hypothetical protein
VTGPESSPPLSRIAPVRIFGLLLLFVAACGYAVLRSERFQRATRALVVRTASEALGRPVAYESMSVSFLPPAVSVKDVRIGGAPGESAPFFEAAELSLGGRVTLIGRTLSIGSLSLSRPRVRLVIFPDGTSNLPPGLSKPSGGGLKIRLGSAAIVGGTLLFNETRIPLDLRLHGFVSELVALPGRNVFRGRLGCRVAGLGLGTAVRIPFDLDARFDVGAGRLHVDALRVSGGFGRLTATGQIPDLSSPLATIWIDGAFDAGRVEEIFGLKLPFKGKGTLAAALRAGKNQPLAITGRLTLARMTAANFTFTDVSALVTAGSEGLTAHIERAGFDGGDLDGTLSISRFDRSPQDFALAVDARRLSIERFFGDIGLPGTGLGGAADLSLGLGWRGGDIEKGDGGARLTIAAVPGGVPVSGGGPIAIRRGFIDLERVELRFPETTAVLDGGFALGDWNPRMRFAIASSDFRSLDAVATGFSRAIQRRKVPPLGLAGSGRIEGTLAGSWAVPSAVARISAENTEYAGLRLGTVFADVTVGDRAFDFRPLRAYDGDARLSLSGIVRYAPRPGSPDFDVTAETARFPVERVLKFFALDFPVTGRVTGTLPVSGTSAAITGEGDMLLEQATVYGQPVERITGRLRLAPGAVALASLRGQIGDAVFGGEGTYAFAGGRFSFQVSGDNLPLSRIAAIGPSKEVAGEVSFHAAGNGTLDHPSLSATLRSRGVRLWGESVPDPLAPSATVALDSGALDLRAGVPGKWSIAVRGPLTGQGRSLSIEAAIPDVAALSEMFPAIPAGLTGELEGAGRVTLADGAWEAREGRITLSKLRLSHGEASIAEAAPITIEYAAGKISTSRARLGGPGTEIDASLSVDTNRGNALSGTISGSVDAGNLETLLGTEAALSGKVAARLTLAGTLERPLPTGRVELTGGRFKSASSPYVLDGIAAQLAWSGTRASLESLRARVGGGDLFASGDAELDGYSVKTFRLMAQAQDVTFRSFEDLSLQANADLTVVGTAGEATVRGELTLLSGTYTKDFAPTLSSLFGKSRDLAYAGARDTWEDHVFLDVRVVSSASLEVRNNLARLTASVDLLARGTLADPVLLGQISIDEGGKITLQDVKYEILSGTITFGNPARTEPVIDITATAEVKGYAINAQAVGTLSFGGRSRVQFNLSSDPPLTDEQIASLLLTGSAPESASSRSGESSTASSVVGSVAGLAIRPVTSRVQQLFRLDRFQVDPILQSVPGSSGGAVITIGKNISKDLSVTYSYSAETNAQSIVLVEYQIDANKVIQASKDENNVYSIGVKFRKRF